MAESKKSRKFDRNRDFCKAYAANQMAEQSKARKLAKHLKRFPWDGRALEALRIMSPLACKKAGVIIPAKVEKSPRVLRREKGVTLTHVKTGRPMTEKGRASLLKAI